MSAITDLRELKHQKMLEDVQQKIAILEESVHQICSTKKSLKQNALEAKSNIHSTISRQLENLRSREVWLLGQVDLIKDVKEQVLCGQQESLKEALGRLHGILDCGAEAASSPVVENAVLENNERFKDLELHAEETPFISFKADPTQLREDIRTFGKVDSRHLPVDAFAYPDGTAASLPRAFEDYDDEEHHVLYKTVGEIQQPGTPHIVNVAIPKLDLSPSPDTSRWLFLPTRIDSDLPATPKSAGSGTFLFPPFDTELKEWLVDEPEVRASVSSVQQWLCDLQHEADVEDEGFEIISATPQSGKDSAFSTDNSSIEILNYNEDGTTLPANVQIGQNAELFPYFEEVCHAPSSHWLKSADKICSSYKYGASYPYETMRYFRDVSNDVKDWLAEYEQSHAKETSDRILTSRCGGNCDQSLPVDGETLDQLLSVHDLATSNISKMPATGSEWLTYPWCKVIDEDRDVNEGSTDDSVVEVNDVDLHMVCCANEPSVKFSDDVSDNSHMKLARSERFPWEVPTNAPPTVKIWLKDTDEIVEVVDQWDVPMFALFTSVPSQDLSQWIVSKEGPVVRTEDAVIVFPPFEEKENHCSHSWLCSDKKVERNEDEVVVFPPFKENGHPHSWLTSALVKNGGPSNSHDFPIFTENVGAEYWQIPSTSTNSPADSDISGRLLPDWSSDNRSPSEACKVSFSHFSPDCSWLSSSDTQSLAHRSESPESDFVKSIQKGFDAHNNDRCTFLSTTTPEILPAETDEQFRPFHSFCQKGSEWLKSYSSELLFTDSSPEWILKIGNKMASEVEGEKWLAKKAELPESAEDGMFNRSESSNVPNVHFGYFKGGQLDLNITEWLFNAIV